MPYSFQRKAVVTNADVFAQILSEASGRPADQVQDLVSTLRKMVGSRNSLNEELSDAEAREIIKDASRRN